MRIVQSIGTTGLCALGLLIVGACSSMPRLGPGQLDVPFWERTSRHVDVVLFHPPGGSLHREGGDSNLHALITEYRDEGMYIAIERARPDFESIIEGPASLLADNGFAVSRIDESELERVVPKLNPFKATTPEELWGFPPYRLRSAAEENREADLLLLVRIDWWGVTRAYALGAVPMEGHQAALVVTADLYDLPGKTLLWSSQVVKRVPLARPWNEPPDFPNMRSAMEQALRECATEMTEELRSWDGVRAVLVYRPPGETKSAANRGER